MPYPGEVLSGLYQIVDEIGKGGAGIIYRAYHLNLQKFVVVKKIKDHFTGILDVRAEADILKSLHHTCLPQVYDFLQIGSDIYTVMDYIDGHDLKYYIDQGYRFEEAALWYWLEQLCDVLSYLHAHGILHLDIKPANIMINLEGNVCLIDFNISLSQGEEGLTGISEVYASPEQYRKWLSLLYGTPDREASLDVRTDLYSLGATFYHLMTGCIPIWDVRKLMPIDRYELPYSGELVKIIRRMMMPERGQRYRSAGKVLQSIQRSRRTKEERRALRIVFFGMLSAILILTAGSLTALYRSRNHAGEEERQRIQQEENYLKELCRSGAYESAYEEGTEFLNTQGRLLQKIPGARQSLQEQVLNACMGLEDYRQAEICLQELLETEEKAEYYQDAAVAAAYLARFDEAEELLGKAESAGADSGEVQRSRAELLAAQGDYEAALEIYQSLMEKEPDAELIRRTGNLALRGSESGENVRLAVSCYEQLLGENIASYEDQMNLVTAYGLCGMDEKAFSLLQSMSVLFEDHYQVYLRLGILKYNAEMKRVPAERDFSKVWEYAEKAKRLQEESNQKDEQLEHLMQLLTELAE